MEEDRRALGGGEVGNEAGSADAFRKTHYVSHFAAASAFPHSKKKTPAYLPAGRFPEGLSLNMSCDQRLRIGAGFGAILGTIITGFLIVGGGANLVVVTFILIVGVGLGLGVVGGIIIFPTGAGGLNFWIYELQPTKTFPEESQCVD